MEFYPYCVRVRPRVPSGHSVSRSYRRVVGDPLYVLITSAIIGLNTNETVRVQNVLDCGTSILGTQALIIDAVSKVSV